MLHVNALSETCGSVWMEKHTSPHIESKAMKLSGFALVQVLNFSPYLKFPYYKRQLIDYYPAYKRQTHCLPVLIVCLINTSVSI